jgi:hypothetical protein
VLDPQQVRDSLIRRGLTVLHVGVHGTWEDTVVVYLHGEAGDQWDGRALRVCRRVPGVVSVEESELAATIIYLRGEAAT